MTSGFHFINHYVLVFLQSSSNSRGQFFSLMVNSCSHDLMFSRSTHCGNAKIFSVREIRKTLSYHARLSGIEKE